jgi:zinc transport system substrate-binding protein
MSASHRALVAFLLSLAIVGCTARIGNVTPESGDQLDITVSIIPQAYFVEQVGGERVKVTAMVLPGQSPATYEPSAEQMAALSRADAYLSIGVPFEDAWLDRIASANPDMLLVDTSDGITRRSVEAHSHASDEEGADAHDSEAAHPDPHIWLSPALVRIQSENIAEALIELDPEHADAYRANLAAFKAELDELDAEIRERLGGLSNRKFMVFHPSWGYFAEDYSLEMYAIEVGGQEPSSAELTQLVRLAKREGIRVVFAQPEFSTRTAEVIAEEIDGRVLLVSPLARDWAENLRQVSETFAEALSE